MKDRFKALTQHLDTLILMVAMGQQMTEKESSLQSQKTELKNDTNSTRIAGDSEIAFTRRGTDVSFAARRNMLRSHPSGKRTQN